MTLVSYLFTGELYDVGWGQKLFLSCKGKGQPTGTYQVAHSLTLVMLNIHTTQIICLFGPIFIRYIYQIECSLVIGLDKQKFSG